MKEKRIVMINENGGINYFNSGIFYDVNERQYCVLHCLSDEDENVGKIIYLKGEEIYKTWGWNIYCFFDCFIDALTDKRVSPLNLKPNRTYVGVKGNKYWWNIKTDNKGEIIMGLYSKATMVGFYKGYRIEDLDFYYTEDSGVKIQERNSTYIIDAYDDVEDFVRDFKLNEKQKEKLLNEVLYGDEL